MSAKAGNLTSVPSFVTVQELLVDPDHDLGLACVAGEKGLNNRVTSTHVQKLGLALTGHEIPIHPNWVQILGRPEITYLKFLSDDERTRALDRLCEHRVPCVVVTRNRRVPSDLARRGEEHDIPILRTKLSSTEFIERVIQLLEERLSPRVSLHGVLVDILGIGVLLLGKSGIGKSECALDLIARGHRLVADDIVDLQLKPPRTIFGRGAGVITYHMEIRGLGVVNIKDLFGVAAIRDRKKVELVIELVEFDSKKEYDRLGIDDEYYTILDVDLPYMVLPVLPGKNLSTLVEVAARNHLLKLKGHHSGREFQETLLQEIESNRQMLRILGDDIE